MNNKDRDYLKTAENYLDKALDIMATFESKEMSTAYELIQEAQGWIEDHVDRH